MSQDPESHRLHGTPANGSLVAFADVHRRAYPDSDREAFQRDLREFVPPDAFDVHAHLYDLRHLVPAAEAEFAGPPEIGHETLLSKMRRWMGDRLITDGLYFPFPVPHLDCEAANEFLAAQLRERPGSRGLMMIRPGDDPDAVARQLDRHRFAGFKVYHVFAERQETFQAEQHEFLPEWAWELAHARGLVIMMHMVLPRALADLRNQSSIRERCRRYPQARLILAHAARGFNARHTVEGIASLRGLENVFFDTSAVCEPTALEAILRTCGPSRLMYGSDFPVSELRGRSLSVGDGFFWLYEHNADWTDWPHAKPQLVGIESLLALQQACRTLSLADRDIERIFSENARQLLGISRPAGERGQSRYREAKVLIPGGTQLLSKRPEMFAPGQWPPYYEEAIGCEVVDVDGRRFIDMSHCGILSCILGFADPDVNAAVIRRVHLGAMSTQQTTDEIDLARLLIEIHPWAAQTRFTRGGGEAMAVAVRIARAFTGKEKLAVCGYHGWHDWYLAANSLEEEKRGRGEERIVNVSSSETHPLDTHLLPGLEPNGVPRSLAGSVATFRYQRLDELDAALRRCGDDLAAIVMEPTRNVDPEPGFLEGVRERADRHGVPLIFDEISSGWRLCLGGAHRLYGVAPDLAVFAKGMSNGFAMGAVIGRADVMQAAQESFISSTYWTEGIGPAAALAAVRKMMQIDVPAHLAQVGTLVMEGWRRLGEKHRLPLRISGRPAACSLSFDHPQQAASREVRGELPLHPANLAGVEAPSKPPAAALLTLLTTRMLEHGFLAGSNCSLTLAHEPYHAERYLEALDEVFAELADAIAAGDVTSRLAGPVKHSTFARLVD
jgi:glutamate-1-semialdehyde 2,1-aminomutase